MLLVTEEAHIVNQLEATLLLAVLALIRLKDPASRNELTDHKVTFVTFEGSFFHFRNDV
jgi:hypothetical protein